MGALAGLLSTLILAAVFGPRQTGRFLAKIRIGYRAQLRDEGESP
ncbi:hypothetical protein FG93_05523 [Bosea sp. LC85]|nr:hypothetical protein [Bosea sp. LC85]KFC64013.1 hypothetical protein FG93_05523 [Bosea sp. LC85]